MTVNVRKISDSIKIREGKRDANPDQLKQKADKQKSVKRENDSGYKSPNRSK